MPIVISCSRIYVDSRLHHMLELNINEAFWDRGDFPAVVQNGSEVVALENPWANGTNAAPFDQRMLLALLHIRTPAHLESRVLSYFGCWYWGNKRMVSRWTRKALVGWLSE